MSRRMVSAMPTVAVYTRLSLDDTKQQTATARQATLCRAFAEARGWTVTEIFEDVDLSAYRRRVVRPDYERLRSEVCRGGVDGVLVWKLDRLVRRPAEFERFWSACEEGGVFLASVTEPVDSSSEIGLAIVRVLVTFAGLESSSTSLRITARLKEKAAAGEPPSGPRPFGLTKGWDEVVPEEAALIREAVRRVLAGEGYRHIAEDWNGRGLVGTRDGAWTSTQVRKLLRSPRLCGDRTWKGDVVAEACFPAILDRLTFDRLQLVMAQRAHGPSPILRQYLLSGLLACGVCAKNLHGRRSANLAYTCTNCGSVCISANSTEALVTRLLFERLAERRRRPRYRTRQAAVTVVRQHADRLSRLNNDYYIGGFLSRDEFLAGRAAIGAATTAARPSEPELVADGLPASFRITNAEVSWSVLTLQQKRAVIAAELDHAVVAKATSSSSRYDPSRVRCQWRDGDGPAPSAEADERPPAFPLRCLPTAEPKRQTDGANTTPS